MQNGGHFVQKCAYTQIARIVGLTWGPPWADMTQVGPMLAPWTLLSGIVTIIYLHTAMYGMVM